MAELTRARHDSGVTRAECGSTHRFRSLCKKCKRHHLKEDAVILCCDCGISLCKRCSERMCGLKSHEMITLLSRQVSNSGSSTDLEGLVHLASNHMKVTPTYSHLYSVCYHCKKKKAHVQAVKHCYDCGKSYCVKCVKTHLSDPNSHWHNLWSEKQFFSKVQTTKSVFPPSSASAPTLSGLVNSTDAATSESTSLQFRD